MQNNAIKAVILDAFGTVIRPVSKNGPYQKILSQASDFRAARNMALTLNADLNELAQALEVPAADNDTLAALRAEVAALTIYEDTTAFLTFLKSEGYRIAICSNLGHAYGQKTRELVPSIENFTFSYEVGYYKPDPRIYQHVCKSLNIEPEDAIFIGDTPSADLVGPRDFGMNSELLKRGEGDTLLSAFNRAISKSA